MSADTSARLQLPAAAVVLGTACAAAAVAAPWLGLAPTDDPMGRTRLLLAGAGVAAALIGLLTDRARAVTGRLRELAADRPGLARFGAVALQLLLLVAVIQQFQLENPVFARRIMPLTLAGFVLHHVL
ncbi:MAG TPA: hypothetical protein VKU85_20125, partial [bacterium]|nr:hypothetical protein [bacterium]